MLSLGNALLTAAGGLLLGVAPIGTLARDSQGAGPAQQPTSVTGCLSKGTAKDTYTLKSKDGKTYTLSSTTVPLKEHVGHEVMVSGTPSTMETGALKDTTAAGASAKKETGAAAAGGTLTVTSLKHLASQCK
jgi:hypothetical protein